MNPVSLQVLWSSVSVSLSDQLYDLMTMAFKYQVLLCPRPKDILLVSFNHMDAIKDFVRDTPIILSQVDETYRQLIEVGHIHCTRHLKLSYGVGKCIIYMSVFSSLYAVACLSTNF